MVDTVSIDKLQWSVVRDAEELDRIGSGTEDLEFLDCFG